MSYWITILPSLLEGLKISLITYVTTLITSMLFGFLLSFVYQKAPKWLRNLINLYTWIIRGTPLLLQLYFMFYALPIIIPMNIRDYRLLFGCITFIVNYTAYYIEIFNGGFSSISKGQWEASTMLGMKTFPTLRYIIFPQVIRNTLHSLGNEAITLVKDTSLLAAVALPDLLMSAKEALSRDARVDALIIVALMYLLLTLIVVLTTRYIMKRFRLEVNK